MRWFFVRSLAFLAAFAAPLAAQTPTPTPANAVEPSDQSAVAPALPIRAGQPNPEVSLGAPAASPTPAATPTPSSAPPELVPLTTKEDTPTVSSPPSSVSPAAGSAHARAGVVSAKPVTVSQGAASTVMSYRKGKSLTVKTPAGSLVEYRVARETVLPSDLAPGRSVLVETKMVRKHRVATKVSYAEGRVVLTNVN